MISRLCHLPMVVVFSLSIAVCVASAPDAPGHRVFLPFDGDRTLSIILSKAIMLAEDNKITDATIVSQLRGR